eukprot:s1_g1850.t1
MSSKGVTMATRKSKGFDLDGSLSHLLRRTQQFAYDQFAQAVSDSGLTPRQFVVLVAVGDAEGLSQTDLVNRTGIDRSTLADMVARMIDRGLLTRKRTKEDARANSVRLSASGRRALKAAEPGAQAAETALLALIPKTVQKDLKKNLGLLADAVTEAKEAAPAPKKKVVTRKKTAKKKTPVRKKTARRK